MAFSILLFSTFFCASDAIKRSSLHKMGVRTLMLASDDNPSNPFINYYIHVVKDVPYDDPFSAQLMDSDGSKIGKGDFPTNVSSFVRDARSGEFLATNGTEFLMRFRPSAGSVDLKAADAKTLTCLGKKVDRVNVVGMVDDFPGEKAPRLLGNLMSARMILIFDPDTAACTGGFNLNVPDAFDKGSELKGFGDANSVEYNPNRGTFVVAGNRWEKMLEDTQKGNRSWESHWTAVFCHSAVVWPHLRGELWRRG